LSIWLSLEAVAVAQIAVVVEALAVISPLRVPLLRHQHYLWRLVLEALAASPVWTWRAEQAAHLSFSCRGTAAVVAVAGPVAVWTGFRAVPVVALVAQTVLARAALERQGRAMTEVIPQFQLRALLRPVAVGQAQSAAALQAMTWTAVLAAQAQRQASPGRQSAMRAVAVAVQVIRVAQGLAWVVLRRMVAVLAATLVLLAPTRQQTRAVAVAVAVRRRTAATAAAVLSLSATKTHLSIYLSVPASNTKTQPAPPRPGPALE